MTQIFSDIDLIHLAPVSYDLELTPCFVEKCVLIIQKVGSCVTKALVINAIMVFFWGGVNAWAAGAKHEI